jgi:hypothetical protein
MIKGLAVFYSLGERIIFIRLPGIDVEMEERHNEKLCAKQRIGNADFDVYS